MRPRAPTTRRSVVVVELLMLSLSSLSVIITFTPRPRSRRTDHCVTEAVFRQRRVPPLRFHPWVVSVFCTPRDSKRRKRFKRFSQQPPSPFFEFILVYLCVMKKMQTGLSIFLVARRIVIP